ANHGTSAVELQQLYRLAISEGLLTEVLGDERHSDRAKQTRLGMALRKYKDRVIAGYRIEVAERAGFSSGRRQQYRLSVSDGGAGIVGGWGGAGALGTLGALCKTRWRKKNPLPPS